MKELAKKLLAIQREMKPIIKEETNPFFKSKYFDINGAIAELRPLLNKHGLVVLQPLDQINGKPAINTMLIDGENGETYESHTPIPEIADVQKMGAAITYFRRYALVSMFLLEAEDDDGESTKPVPATQPSAAQKPTAQGTSKACSQCGKDFVPNPQYPRATTCSWQCANAKKANAKPELPTINADDRDEFVPPFVE